MSASPVNSFSTSAPGALSRMSKVRAVPPASVRERGHAGDVDLVPAEDGAELTDDAGDVVVLEQQNHAFGCDLDGSGC